jgi:hypothetical protein
MTIYSKNSIFKIHTTKFISCEYKKNLLRGSNSLVNLKKKTVFVKKNEPDKIVVILLQK